MTTSDNISNVIDREAQKIEERRAKRKLQEEFSNFDCSELPKMKDSELAAWQAKYPMDSPQYIIALQEWNRRALVKQIKATKWAAFMGLIGVILGSALTAFITWFLSPN